MLLLLATTLARTARYAAAMIVVVCCPVHSFVGLFQQWQVIFGVVLCL